MKKRSQSNFFDLIRKNNVMKNQLNILVTLLALTLISNCAKNDDEQITSEGDTNVTIIDIGEYTLLEESIAALPYLNKTSITFVDSLANQVEFSIQEFDLLQIDSAFLYKYNVYEPGDTVLYKYAGEIKRFKLQNDSLGMVFDLSLRARPYYEDPEQGYVADVLEIICSNPDSENSYSTVFYHVVDRRTWPFYIPSEVISGIEIIERLFYDVYLGLYDKSEVYFNFEYGIVSFTDRDENLWRFESME